MGDLDSESENGPQNQNRFDDQSVNAVSEQRTQLYGNAEESTSQIGAIQPDIGIAEE